MNSEESGDAHVIIIAMNRTLTSNRSLTSLATATTTTRARPCSLPNYRHQLRSIHSSPPTALASTSPSAFNSSRIGHDYHFDTHHFVQRLEAEGLNRAQAEGIMNAMAEVIDESIRNMTNNMVTKAEQEKVGAYTRSQPPRTQTEPGSVQHHYTQQVDFTQTKSELMLISKNDLAMLKAETDRLMSDIEKLRQRLREDITRTQAGVRLDLNLEKGRLREESTAQELKIKEVDTRIEQEIAALRTNIQASKATTLQYLVGFGACSVLIDRWCRC